MTFFVYEEVFGLEVAVGYIHSVKVLESKENFASEEQSNVICKPSFSPQQREQLATACIVQKHVDVGRCLEVALQINDEWMVNDGKDFLLTFDVINLLEFDNRTFLQTL